jgi:hypothetical protein
MPFVHYQNVILLDPSVITQLCSPLLVEPTQTKAFRPIPKSKEQRR